MRARLVTGLVLTAVLLQSPAAAQTDEAEHLYTEGVEARLDGRFDEAVERLQDAALIQPDNADTQVQLGLALTGAGELDAAETALRRALELAPDYTDARIGLARIAFRRDRLNDAEATLAPVLSDDPENEDARALSQQIESAQAEGEAERARQAERDAQERRDREAREVAERAQQEAAEREAARRAELAHLTEEARSLRVHGRFEESQARYAKALQREPGNADLLVGLGLAQGFAGDHAAARASFERALARDPASLDARLGLARVALWTDDLAQAEQRVAAVVAEAPQNPDALALRARILLAGGRARQAEADFAAIIAADPANVEALVGLGDARRARGREGVAREAYESALALDPASADVRSRLETEPPPRWRLDIDGAYSDLSGDLEPWREGTVRLGYQLAPGTVISGGAEMSHRFGAFDTYLEGRIDHRFTPWLSGYALLGATPDADFRPNYQVGAGAGVRVSQGLGGVLGPSVVTLDLRHADYETGGIQTVSPGLEQYLFDGRLWLTGRWINTFVPDGGRTDGWFLRADAQLHDRLRIFAGLSDAPDISDGVVLDTFSTFGGLVFDVVETVSLRASLAREKRDEAYDRTVFSIGLGLRF